MPLTTGDADRGEEQERYKEKRVPLWIAITIISVLLCSILTLAILILRMFN